MRILQIGKFYPLKGGVEKVIYALAEGLSQHGIRCDAMFAGCERQPRDFDLNDLCHIYLCRNWKEVKATMIAPSMITTLRKIQENYDIIHIHHPDPMAALALFLSGYKGKVVLHWHCDIVRQNRLLVLYNPLQKWLIRRADIIVGTSPVYIHHSPALQRVQDKCCYIPIGIYETASDSKLVSDIKQRYGNRKIVFSLGRLVLYKGYEYLIEAAQYLSDDYVVLIGGNGNQYSKLQSLIKEKGLQDKVHLLGFIPEEQLGSYFEASHLFCLSSIDKREAFAIVQAKAMSHSKPVVSTNIPESGVNWVNKHGFSGLNVPPCDSRAIASAIEEVSSDETLYHRYCLQSRQHYEEHFRMYQMIEAHQKLYNKLLG